jgi:hypothetical protein
MSTSRRLVMSLWELRHPPYGAHRVSIIAHCTVGQKLLLVLPSSVSQLSAQRLILSFPDLGKVLASFAISSVTMRVKGFDFMHSNFISTWCPSLTLPADLLVRLDSVW